MRERISLTGLVTALAGLALLIWIVARVGAVEIAADIRQVGWGLAAIVALGGLRFLARAIAWRAALEPGHTLTLGEAFAAVVCGDAVGNITPLGPIVGEPAKAAFVRDRVALGPAVAALAIENVLYTLSAAAMIAAGMAALMFRFELPAAIETIGRVAVIATAILFLVALGLLWRQPAVISGALSFAPRMQHHAVRIRDLEGQIYSFVARRPGSAMAVAAAEALFHALGVVELYLTLWLLYGNAPSLLTAFILETTNRLIIVVFKFVPLRLGVDEAGTALFTQVLGLGPNTGVAVAIVRKARVLFWTAAGGVLLVRAGTRRAR
jgi:lysylphosphatidylglycerol synthase-like protein